MDYIPSVKIKEEEMPYHGIERMIPWVIKDGILPLLLKKYAPLAEACLDVGCGRGFALMSLRGVCKKLYGIDLSSYLSEDAVPFISFSKIDLNFEKLPYADASMDIVTAFQVVEHLENPFFAMREAWRVLRAGGLFIMSVPNPFNLAFRMKFLLTGNMPPWSRGNNHLLFLTKDVFEKTYLKNFALCETVYQKGALPFWGRFQKIFFRRIVKRHLMILPRSELFSRRVCYVLKKN